MERRVFIVVVAMGCGPTVGVGDTDGDGSAEGGTTSASASDDGSADDLDGCNSQCRVSGTELWQILLPPLSSCPRLAALDEGGVAVVGNERFAPDVSIPHVLVVETDGGVRWTSQGGHWKYDEAVDTVADPIGFVVVGHGDAPNGRTGWMQRWAADGAMDAEVILDMDELGDQISDIEGRDATSYWIVATDDELATDVLCSRSFDDPPASAMALVTDAFDVQLARAPDEGAYVSADAEVGTLTRVDRDGSVLWTLEYAAPIDTVPFTLALASTATGDAIVAGTDQGEPDAQWIRRFASDGNELWRVPVEVGAAPNEDLPLHVAVDGADAIFVVGWSQIETGNDGFLARYDRDGVELWQSILPAEGELNVRPCDVAVASDGTLVVAGTEFVAGESPTAYWLRAFTP
ncbi:MAG: hypothetical protein IAG13_05860 [Deltaproteobacteria bacterium]|nr:hypothetical protein [Nannocystaceae bacterium]